MIFDICELLFDICEHIANGTPLPKGHGDLKDADALKHKFISYGYDYGKDELDEAPTIIEADTKREEV